MDCRAPLCLWPNSQSSQNRSCSVLSACAQWHRSVVPLTEFGGGNTAPQLSGVALSSDTSAQIRRIVLAEDQVGSRPPLSSATLRQRKQYVDAEPPPDIQCFVDRPFCPSPKH